MGKKIIANPKKYDSAHKQERHHKAAKKLAKKRQNRAYVERKREQEGLYEEE